jgi:Flp pilus assembly protein CpaB
MKQKNMILVGVAIGFGLLAALLATQMNAKPAGDVVNEIELPVAAKDIAISSKLDKNDISSFVTWKKYKKDAMPPGEYATTEAELADKRVIRTFHEGELFGKKDLSDRPMVEIPANHDMMSFNINRAAIVGGFAVPGSRVDILASIRLSKLSKSITFPLMKNMLILAVDVQTTPDKGQPMPNVSDVSMAVTKEQAMMLHAAIGRNADMRLLLLGQNNKENKYDEASSLTEEQIWKVLADDFDPNAKGKEDPKKEGPVFVTADLPVPMEDLPAGTELTKELIDTKFTVLPIKPPAPDNFVHDIREQMGKFLTKDVTANQFVPKAYLTDKISRKEVVLKPVGPPPVFHDTVVQTPSGVRKFRYQLRGDGKTWDYLGEVKIEEDPTAANKDKPDGDGKPEENKKPATKQVTTK